MGVRQSFSRRGRRTPVTFKEGAEDGVLSRVLAMAMQASSGRPTRRAALVVSFLRGDDEIPCHVLCSLRGLSAPTISRSACGAAAGSPPQVSRVNVVAPTTYKYGDETVGACQGQQEGETTGEMVAGEGVFKAG